MEGNDFGRFNRDTNTPRQEMIHVPLQACMDSRSNPPESILLPSSFFHNQISFQSKNLSCSQTCNSSNLGNSFHFSHYHNLCHQINKSIMETMASLQHQHRSVRYTLDIWKKLPSEKIEKTHAEPRSRMWFQTVI